MDHAGLGIIAQEVKIQVIQRNSGTYLIDDYFYVKDVQQILNVIHSSAGQSCMPRVYTVDVLHFYDNKTFFLNGQIN